VQIGDVDRLTAALEGIRRTAPGGLAQWRYQGRVVARQLDDEHVVIRADFDYRDSLMRQFPGTFSVPDRFARHMMVVADLAGGDLGAIEDALEAAWRLQRSGG
jgi:hypothetical protein